MKKFVLLSVVALLAACNKAEAPPSTANDMSAAAADENAAAANMGDANVAAPTALSSPNETTWEFTDPKSGKPMRESVDAAGNYITQAAADGMHVDHGSTAMKDGKLCFTSAMTKDGEMCWSDPMLSVGQSGESVSDKGDKLTVKRVDYVAMKM